MPQAENTTPLTDEQRELVAANIRLAWWAVGVLPRLAEALGTQEAVSLAHLALCRAVRVYDPSRGKLSPLVMRYVKQQLVHAVTSSRRKKRGSGMKPLPLDAARHRGVCDADPDEPTPWLARAIDGLDACDRAIVRLWAGFEGEPLTDKQIGRRLGYSRSTVSQWRHRALAELRGQVPAGVAAEEGGSA